MHDQGRASRALHSHPVNIGLGPRVQKPVQYFSYIYK